MRFLYERGVQALCVLIIIGVISLIAIFLARLPPPATTPFNIATLFYMNRDYEEALNILRPLVKEKPDNEEVNYLYAETLLRSKRKREAETVFSQLVQKYPKSEEMQLGLAEASANNAHYETAIPLLENLRDKHPRNKKIYPILAEAYFLSGDNLKAAETYRFMIGKNWNKEEATKRFLALYGTPTYSSRMPLNIPEDYVRPTEVQIHFRTNKDFLEVYENDKWSPLFMKGLNLTNAAPGYYVANPPTDFAIYADWLKLLADMNSNTVRLYILGPPAFYQALKAHNERYEKKLWLFQEVWLTIREPSFQIDKEAYNLFDPAWQEEFRRDIRETVDVLHGRGNIPKRQGRTGGIYTADVSDYVITIGLGKEVETYIVEETDQQNPTRTSYEGKYVSIKKGTPTEAWFAEMCDYTVEYEMIHFNSQHPTTVINAPQFDAMSHPSEATIKETNKWEKIYGIPETGFNRFLFNNDAVGLDVTKFSVSADFPSGIYACFHNYPHWPDFMWADQKYAEASDRWGPNPFWGYLVDMKETHKDFPLLLGEYGVSTSWYPVYNTVNSVDQGGYTVWQQAELMDRWTLNAHEAKYCGVLAFELLDEWWHTSVNLFSFMNESTRALWFNVIDGESNYGFLTFQAPAPIPLLRGNKDDWKKAKKMASTSLFTQHKPGDLKRVYAYSDFAFLYIRLDAEPWNDGKWDNKEYWIALSTLPGQFGSQALPGLDLKMDSGANFLIRLQDNQKGEILISQNYNPHEWVEAPPILGGKELYRKTSLPQTIAPESPFEEILLPTQPYHFGRDGTIYPAMQSNLSTLRYGNADPTSKEFNNLAAWHVDSQSGMIEIRIPWMSLMVIDPPSQAVLSDLVPRGKDLGSPTKRTPGIGMVALRIDNANQKHSLQTLPKARDGNIPSDKLPLYLWNGWIDPPAYEPILKPVYFDMQKLFKTLEVPEGQHEKT